MKKFNAKMQIVFASTAAGILLSASSAMAQETGAPIDTEVAPPPAFDPSDTVFDDTWISVGIGGGIGPSYTGSNDYVLFPAPIIQGQIGPVGISPRPAGLALDFVPAPKNGGLDIDLGVTFRLRSDRASQIEDPVVEAAGELDRAFEVGPSVGISFPALLNPFDSLSFGVDARWDIAGAHDGMVIDPSITYFTPINRGLIASLSLSTEFVDDSYADYYFSVDGTQGLASGLPFYTAKDGGFTKVGANLLIGVDFDGDATNGGLGAVVITGYSRLLGDAKNNPYTSVRGSADQFLLAVGLGYTF